MYLCELLCRNNNTQMPEVYAAMALMHFHAARIDSRTGEGSEVILLSHQDRSKWDTDLIQQGVEYMNRAAYGEEITSYHIEAAIAYEHCSAPRFEDTNWRRILTYYDWLAALIPSSIVWLNRLTVVYKISGAEAVMEEIKNSTFIKDWEKHYLYHSLSTLTPF